MRLRLVRRVPPVPTQMRARTLGPVTELRAASSVLLAMQMQIAILRRHVQYAGPGGTRQAIRRCAKRARVENMTMMYKVLTSALARLPHVPLVPTVASGSTPRLALLCVLIAPKVITTRMATLQLHVIVTVSCALLACTPTVAPARVTTVQLAPWIMTRIHGRRAEAAKPAHMRCQE